MRALLLVADAHLESKEDRDFAVKDLNLCGFVRYSLTGFLTCFIDSTCSSTV